MVTKTTKVTKKNFRTGPKQRVAPELLQKSHSYFRMRKLTLLAIPGSLRARSSSHLVLQLVAGMMPDHVTFLPYDGVGTLPHFDDRDHVPEAVADFRKRVAQADAVLICTPEYAHGIPGSLKNALDWTVSSGEFVNKPVGLITASSSGEYGHPALLEVLRAISAHVIDDATLLIPNIRSRFDQQGAFKEESLAQSLKRVVASLVAAAQEPVQAIQ